MPRAIASPSPAASRGEISRERVLDAAAALFAERGFASVTMRAIGEAAGLDNSSLYRHFESKSELAGQVLHRAMQRLAAEVAPRIETTPSTRAGIVDLLASIALYFWDEPATARLVLHWVTSARDAKTGFDVSLPALAVGAPSGEVVRGVMRCVAEARAAGEIRDFAMPEAFVTIFGALLLRPATYGDLLASQEPERSGDQARSAWEAEVRALLVRGLAP
jgi:AcrR family transcriptional regulator